MFNAFDGCIELTTSDRTRAHTHTHTHRETYGLSDVFTSLQISSQHPFRATMEPRDRDGGSGLFTLHQIQTVHSCNEYTESPTNWARPQVSDSAQVEGPDDHTLDSSHSPQSERRSTEIGTSSEQRTVEGEIVVKEQPEIFEPGAQMGLFVICTQELSLLETLGQKVTAVEEQPCSFDSKQDVLEVPGSCISEQRSLASVAEPDVAIREQPKSSDLKEEETKLLGSSSTDHNMESKQETTKQHNKKHPTPCVRCRRCKCRDCAAATPLPSCWLCGRRCLCSAEAVVEYSTCVCCLKAVLYHCSSDDEDSSADAPFSCRESRRCTRWSTAAAMAFFLPCLLCYGPARGCLALCQLCHNCTHRTGCRCKDPKVAQDF